jgi:hypothetical protein
MKTRHWSCIALLVLLVPVLSYGQQQAGDWELQFQGSYYTTIGTDYEFGSGNISAKIGPYVTNYLQVGVGPSVTISTTSFQSYNPTTFEMETTSETKTTFGSTAFLVFSYLTRGAKLVPYAGVQYFISDVSEFENDKGSMGVNAGVKYFFAKKTAFDLSGNYLFSLNGADTGATLLFAVGLSFLF